MLNLIRLLNDPPALGVPIVCGEPCPPSVKRFDSVGTLSVVNMDGCYYFVTANHVLRRFEDKPLLAPVERHCGVVQINSDDWFHILSVSDSANFGDGTYDLVWRKLDDAQVESLNPAFVCRLGRATEFSSPFNVVAFGYLNKQNTARKRQIRNRIIPSFFQMRHPGVRPSIKPPYARAQYEGKMKLYFDRKGAKGWSRSSFAAVGHTAPIPSGLSGGPIVVEKSLSHTGKRAGTVVGFVTKYIEADKTLEATTSDVLIDCIRRSAYQQTNTKTN